MVVFDLRSHKRNTRRPSGKSTEFLLTSPPVHGQLFLAGEEENRMPGTFRGSSTFIAWRSHEDIMSALHELLGHLGNPHYDGTDYERAMLALLDRLDRLQDVTIMARRTGFDDVVDASISPEGNVYIVKRISNLEEHGRQLCVWDLSPMGHLLGRLEVIATADYIRLCGFPDGKTLAWASYTEGDGGRLHFGDWASDRVLNHQNNGALFWEHRGQVYAFAPAWIGDKCNSMRIYALPNLEPIIEVRNETRDHQVVNGELAWVEVDDELGERLARARWGKFISARYSPAQAITVCVKKGLPQWILHREANSVIVKCQKEDVLTGQAWRSGGRIFDVWQVNVSTPGGNKPWQLNVKSLDHGWLLKRDFVSGLKAIISDLPDDNTVLLVNPNTKHKRDSLEVVFVDADGHTTLGERVDGATGKMKRLGDLIAVEGRNECGPTVTFFRIDAVVEYTTHALVGRFDRLTTLQDGTVVGWHYTNGAVAIQHYPSPR